jgi:aminopeptidase C
VALPDISSSNSGDDRHSAASASRLRWQESAMTMATTLTNVSEDETDGLRLL